MVSWKTGLLFVYNLVQFLGFSWIFVNMTVRLITFGKGEEIKTVTALSLSLSRALISEISLISDSLSDTFHTISDVMFFCQILATVEVLNAAFGIVRTGVFPTLIQV